MKKEIKIVILEEEVSYKIPSNPVEFLKFWKDIVGLIPDEFIDDAKIEIRPSSDYYTINVYAYACYSRAG